MRIEQRVPLVPGHRPVWRRFRRRCVCGLRWPCQDRQRPSGHSAQPDNVADPRWNAPTRAQPQVGRAGLLTPGQRWRANQGRW